MKISLCVVVISICLLFSPCYGDIYMQNPRGSNDRLNETGDRQNENRLFNSQNNARGGYCWGPPLSFYAGSELSIEWTAQHACGEGTGVKCNYVLQYMCGYDDGPADVRIRDGVTTGTITDDPDEFNQLDSDGDFVHGMHESYTYYQSCKGRSRNNGLFTADQNVGTNTAATRTRQNNGGTQHGFECPEERDYYPYWGPSPWKDIAVLAYDSKTLCSYYQKESQNVKGREYCNGNPAINQQSCLSAGGSWASAPAWGITKPDCLEAPYSRDNHLGNGMGGYTASYNWTLPTSDTEKCVIGSKCVCVLRIRYNISTDEIDGYGQDDQANTAFTDSTNNKNPPLSTNPNVMVLASNLTLAVNTAQYGRTFQDRSHVFKILARPSGVSDSANIYNLNVRGKRGNIVQTYPATEYDFVPKQLEITVGDYVHFQWTGCDTNPANNDGEGTDSTDRSNLVQMLDNTLNHPITDADWVGSAKKVDPLFEDVNQRYLMAHIGQTGCKTLDELLADNNDNQAEADQDTGNCMKLNAAPTPYFDGGLLKMNTTGTFYYMNTRNNNFSNRTQKGVMVVSPVLPAWAIALIVIGSVVAVGGIAAGGLIFYAHKFPHSAVAAKYDVFKTKTGSLFRKIMRKE